MDGPTTMRVTKTCGPIGDPREKSDISEQRCNMLMSDTVQYAVLSPSFFLRIHIVSCCCDSGSALLVDVLRIAVVYFMIRVLVGGCITHDVPIDTALCTKIALYLV